MIVKTFTPGNGAEPFVIMVGDPAARTAGKHAAVIPAAPARRHRNPHRTAIPAIGQDTAGRLNQVG